METLPKGHGHDGDGLPEVDVVVVGHVVVVPSHLGPLES